uniref:Glycophorin C (Gerbich blood group) n=1 Tax=Callithrix jacchus TaxID=9483 RepID=A0A8I3XCA6_CALJA
MSSPNRTAPPLDLGPAGISVSVGPLSPRTCSPHSTQEPQGAGRMCMGPSPTAREPDPGMASTSTATDIAIIAGVIAAVAIVLVCLLIVMLHYMCRHKGTYHTNEAKGTEFAESADAALQGDPALQDAGDSSRKEYFI